MDHSWRPPPPQHPGINTTVCPICSISHFPFCPLPPSIENPRFHYSQPHQIDYYHQRPPISHNYHHPPPFQNHQDRNYYHNPSDGHGTWYGTLNMNPYDGIRDPSTGIRNHPGGGPNYGVKRMKFDNNMGPLMGGETSRFPSENERILKLIHDHGKAANTTPPTESNGSKRRHEEMSKISSMGMASLYGNNNVLHYDQTNERGQSKYETPLPHPSDYTSQPANSFGTSFGPSGSQPSPPPRNNFFEPPPPPPPNKPSLFPVTVSSSVDSALGSVLLEKQQSTPLYYRNNASQHASPISSNKEFPSRQSLSDKHARDIQPFQSRHLSSEKQNTIDASHIFKLPHRASRPDHFVIILRGLPGSGKSYLAKLLRDIEIENGGVAPRIHSMDDYFMIEVEKAEDSELSNLSGSLRGKRQVMKTVMEYCYEPDMEEAYRASMLKAFKKTLDEGDYSFIIVDDRNLRVADFAQFWATAKRSGYEVYLVEASYKDPVGCAARNVHNFTLPDVQKMAGQWEEAPSLYLRMDIKSLLHGEGFDESDIQEVDMDMEDEDASDDETRDEVDDSRPHGIDEAKVKLEEVNDLSRSKWSNDLDAEEEEGGGGGGGKKTNSVGALSGLIQAYSSSKEAKSVCWGDQGGNDGFSISATRKTNTRSLVIGPGPGYNLKSNPLSEDEHLLKAARNGKSQNVFQQQTRAERESFKAVFDKRRLRIVDED